MGQAKRRGTLEERKAQAVARLAAEREAIRLKRLAQPPRPRMRSRMPLILAMSLLAAGADLSGKPPAPHEP